MSLGGAQAPQLGCVEVCNGGGQRRDRTAVDFGGRPTRLRLIVGKMPSSTIDSVCDAGLLPTRRHICTNSVSVSTLAILQQVWSQAHSRFTLGNHLAKMHQPSNVFSWVCSTRLTDPESVGESCVKGLGLTRHERG